MYLFFNASSATIHGIRQIIIRAYPFIPEWVSNARYYSFHFAFFCSGNFNRQIR